MEKQIVEFIKLLKMQKEIYEKLLELSEEKKSAISKGIIEELDKIVRSEQVLVIKASDVERRRKTAADSIAKIAGITGTSLTLRKLIEIAPSNFTEELKTLHADLSVVIEKQLKINEVNRQLLESRIQYINYMIGNIAPNADNTNKYGSSGEDTREETRKTSIIDQKV